MNGCLAIGSQHFWGTNKQASTSAPCNNVYSKLIVKFHMTSEEVHIKHIHLQLFLYPEERGGDVTWSLCF